MSDLVEFLRARLDEDEGAARAATEDVSPELVGAMFYGDLNANWIYHASRRTLAEVEAKRRIVDRLASSAPWADGGQGARAYFDGFRDAMTHTLRLLALPYADHPDYREEWRP